VAAPSPPVLTCLTTVAALPSPVLISLMTAMATRQIRTAAIALAPAPPTTAPTAASTAAIVTASTAVVVTAPTPTYGDDFLGVGEQWKRCQKRWIFLLQMWWWGPLAAVLGRC
jgi:hypothetical protein